MLSLDQVFNLIMSIVLAFVAIGITGTGLVSRRLNLQSKVLLLIFSPTFIVGYSNLLELSRIHEMVPPLLVGFYAAGTGSFVASSLKRHRQEEADIKRILNLDDEVEAEPAIDG